MPTPAKPKTRRGGTKASAKPKVKARLTKHSTKVDVKTKREAVSKVFGFKNLSYKEVNFLYSRRHLATVRGCGHRELKYVVELDDLEMVTLKTLDRIHQRDGQKTFREVAESFLGLIARSVKHHADP
jgi:hypothetical protein